MSDALTMSGRSIRLSMRHLDALITALLLPVMLMLMFVELFGGAIRTGAGSYVTYVVPGVMLLCAGFGSATTAVSVSQDMTGGIVGPVRAMGAGGAAGLGRPRAAGGVGDPGAARPPGAPPPARGLPPRPRPPPRV